MNNHVYLYYRFLGWMSEEHGAHWSAFLYRDAARQELERQ